MAGVRAVTPIDEQVKNLIAEIIEADPAKIEPEANLVEDLGMDSMMALEIIATLEKRYRIKIREEELPTITTLSRVIELTKRYVKATVQDAGS